MDKNEMNFQLFIFPIRYRTVSFHHQANYQIKFTPYQKSFTMCTIHPIHQIFTKQVSTKIDRNGNVWNVDGFITNQTDFKTEKFQIEFNDQLIKFKTGFLAKITPSNQSTISVNMELMRHMQTIGKPQNESILKKVSSQTIHINLKYNDSDFNIRRIVFATNQYISYLDIGYQFVQLNHICLPIDQQQSQLSQLRRIYRSQIIDRLKVYRQLSIRVKQKISQFQDFQLSNFNYLDTATITLQFQEYFVFKDIPNLDYIALQLKVEQQNFDSNVGLNKYDQQNNPHKNRQIIDVLLQHYQCETIELMKFIRSQGKLIQRNIRALFQRSVQLSISLFGQQSLFIEDNQINRVTSFIQQSEKNINQVENKSLACLDFSIQTIKNHKQKMNSYLKLCPNFIGLQRKQPYVQIINFPQLLKTNKLHVDNTLTVFIHGYKGNQYDLSKIKSHLNLLLGYNNFYSIKGLNTDKANSQTIYKLGQTAANELNTYLSISPFYRHINIIGFSLGGLIARAMLPWIESHKDKLNLLVTIASPHLGLRQIQSCIVRAGLCYMRRMAGVQSIRQLNSERNETKSRYLLELAQGKHLQWFKFIVLVGSHIDSYVPAYSSLVQYQGDDQMTLEMSRRLQQKLKKAVRCVAQLQYNQTLFQMITKRRSHISFLEEDSFIKYLIVKFQDLFSYDS